MRRPSAALGRRQPETGTAQPTHELPALHVHGAGGDHLGPVLLGDVVVVALEPTSGEAGEVGEVVQLVVADIADQVTPLATPEPPARFVDQDRHLPTMSRTPGTLGP